MTTEAGRENCNGNDGQETKALAAPGVTWFWLDAEFFRNGMRGWKTGGEGAGGNTRMVE